MNDRNRNYCLITYHTPETVQTVLDMYKHKIAHWAYIVHDKDKNEDGTDKQSHMHILLHLKNGMTLTAVRALFPDNQNTLGQVVVDKVGCVAYLTHSNAPEKYQYSDIDIVSNDIEYFQNLTNKSERNDDFIQLLDDIISGTSFREMVKRYGRDYVINYHKYVTMAMAIKDEEKEHEDFTGWEIIANKKGVTYINPQTGETVYKPRIQQLQMEL